MDNFWATGRASVTRHNTSLPGLGGLHYSPLEVGPVFLGLAGSLPGRLLDAIWPLRGFSSVILNSWAHVFAVLTGALAASCLVLVAAMTLRSLSIDDRRSAFWAFAVVLGSPAFETCRYLLSNAPAALALGLLVLAMARAREERRRGSPYGFRVYWPAATGLFMACVIRATTPLFVAAFAAGWCVFSGRRWREYIIPALAVGIGIAFRLAYNYHRLGMWFTTGYTGQYQRYMIRTVWEGLFLYLVFPRNSIFVNSPLTTVVIAWGLLALPGTVGRAVRSRALSQVAVPALYVAWAALLVAPNVIVYTWFSDSAIFTTRYMSETMYFLNLASAAVVERRLRHRHALLWLVPAGIAIVGVAMHFVVTLIPPARYSQPFYHDELRSVSSMLQVLPFAYPECVQFVRQYMLFPKPDWLVYYLTPQHWPAVTLATYAVALAFIWMAVRNRNGARQLKALAAFLLVGMLPIALMCCLGTWRTKVLTASPLNIAPTAESLGIQRVDIYTCGGMMVADYTVEFGPLKKAFPKGGTCILASTLEGASKRVGFSQSLGFPELNQTYVFEREWTQMPAGSTTVLTSLPLQSPVREYMVPGVRMAHELRFAFADGNKPAFRVGTWCFPATPLVMKNTAREFAGHKNGAQWQLNVADFLGDDHDYADDIPAFLGYQGGSCLGVAIPALRLAPDWTHPEVQIGFVCSGVDSETSLHVFYDGQSFGTHRLQDGRNYIKCNIGSSSFAKAVPFVFLTLETKAARAKAVPVYARWSN